MLASSMSQSPWRKPPSFRESSLLRIRDAARSRSTAESELRDACALLVQILQQAPLRETVELTLDHRRRRGQILPCGCLTRGFGISVGSDMLASGHLDQSVAVSYLVSLEYKNGAW